MAGEKWDFDAFWTRPVIVDPTHFDSNDHNQDFAGAWATYRPVKGTTLDMYYLYLDNRNPKTQLAIALAPFTVPTLGDRDPNKGHFNTFNQLFPFGHYYFGFLDLVGRENIHDFNLNFYMNPTKWITFNAQGHIFRLDQAQDALYNAGGNAIRRSAKGTASRNVGDEIDLLVNFHLGAHSDVLAGYSKLFAGDFIRNTGNGLSPDLFYLCYNFRW